MNWNEWKRTSAIYAYGNKDRLEKLRLHAISLVNEFLSVSKNGYIAYSGGKDSAVLLHLVLSIAPLPVIFHDEGWVFPKTIEFIQETESFYGLSFIRTHEIDAADEFKAEFGHNPKWEPDRHLDWIGKNNLEMLSYYRWDGCLTGMRTEESQKRFFALRQPLRWNKSLKIWRCDPLYDWELLDVWAYLIQNQLPIHPSYHDMIDIDIPPQHARIGPLTAVRVYQYGSLNIIKRLYPGLWNKFVAANPCVSHYG